MAEEIRPTQDESSDGEAPAEAVEESPHENEAVRDRDLRRIISLVAGTLLLLAFCAAFAAIPGSDGWSGEAARGDTLASEHRLLSAIEAYQAAARRPGGDPAALSRLGDAYFRRGQWQDAAKTLQIALVAGETAPGLLRELATAQDKAGDLQGSLTTLRSELRLHPDDGGAWNQLVERAAQSGLLGDEIRQRLAGAPAPVSPAADAQKAFYLQAACLLEPDSEAGAQALERAVQGPDPRTAAAARELSDAVHENDGSARAIDVARALLAQDLLGPALGYLNTELSGPLEAERQALLGYVLMQTGQLDRAEEALRRSQQLAPDLQIGQYMMGRFLLARGDAAAAANLLAKAAKQRPANPAIYLELANALVDAGDYGTAEQALNLAIEAAPDSGDVRLAVASFYVDRQYRVEQALPTARAAVQMLGRSAASLSTLAWGLHLSGQSQDALGLMLEAVAKEPESAEFRYRLGSIYQGLGRRAEAREQFLMVHELDASGTFWKRAQEALASE